MEDIEFYDSELFYVQTGPNWKIAPDSEQFAGLVRKDNGEGATIAGAECKRFLEALEAATDKDDFIASYHFKNWELMDT